MSKERPAHNSFCTLLSVHGGPAARECGWSAGLAANQHSHHLGDDRGRLSGGSCGPLQLSARFTSRQPSLAIYALSCLRSFISVGRGFLFTWHFNQFGLRPNIPPRASRGCLRYLHLLASRSDTPTPHQTLAIATTQYSFSGKAAISPTDHFNFRFEFSIHSRRYPARDISARLRPPKTLLVTPSIALLCNDFTEDASQTSAQTQKKWQLKLPTGALGPKHHKLQPKCSLADTRRERH